jgi:hypothetical protein
MSRNNEDCYWEFQRLMQLLEKGNLSLEDYKKRVHKVILPSEQRNKTHEMPQVRSEGAGQTG